MRRRATHSTLLILAAAVAILLLLQWQLDFHWGAPASALEPEQTTNSATKPTPTSSPAAAPPAMDPATQTLHEQLSEEAMAMAVPAEDPQQIEARLQKRAQAMTDAEISSLRKILIQGQASGDEAALALDLLGRSDQKAASELLLDFALKGATTPAREQATLQLLAVEGLSDQAERNREPAALLRIQRESSDSILVQRATQSLGALKGQNPWPRETDEKSMHELMED